MKFNKELRRKRIHNRIRRKIRGTSERPRLSVFRSNKAIYCQLVDDINGVTILSASSNDEGVPAGQNKTEQAKAVGQLLGKKASSANITQLVFDRSGYLYHGRVKALADGVRESGIKF